MHSTTTSKVQHIHFLPEAEKKTLITGSVAVGHTFIGRGRHEEPVRRQGVTAVRPDQPGDYWMDDSLCVLYSGAKDTELHCNVWDVL